MTLANINGGGQLDAAVAPFYNAWSEGFRSEFSGYPFVQSAWRSPALQQALYNAWIASGRKGSTVAPPGHSLHETGHAIDIHSGVEQRHSEQHAYTVETIGAYGGRCDLIAGEPWHIQFDIKPTIRLASTSAHLLDLPEEGDTEMRAIQCTIDDTNGAIPLGFYLVTPTGVVGAVASHRTTVNRLNYHGTEEPWLPLAGSEILALDTSLRASARQNITAAMKAAL